MKKKCTDRPFNCREIEAAAKIEIAWSHYRLLVPNYMVPVINNVCNCAACIFFQIQYFKEKSIGIGVGVLKLINNSKSLCVGGFSWNRKSFWVVFSFSKKASFL